eukprot:7239314-Lingulodinium_polyedra.AAC.1
MHYGILVVEPSLVSLGSSLWRPSPGTTMGANADARPAMRPPIFKRVAWFTHLLGILPTGFNHS